MSSFAPYAERRRHPARAPRASCLLPPRNQQPYLITLIRGISRLLLRLAEIARRQIRNLMDLRSKEATISSSSTRR